MFSMFFVMTVVLAWTGADPVLVGFTGLISTLGLVLNVVSYVCYERDVKCCAAEEDL